jgi:glycerol-3-phosphate O-acyltransferase / dihydroxyacetone phosphate acyltransferase
VLYQLLRGTAAIALRWYYADVAVQGSERVPHDGPLLILANHPNALIDPLLVGTAIDRRVLLTAKATLFEHPALALLLEAAGVVPLRRAKDESRDGVPAPATPERNAIAFQRVTSALRACKVVLIFPEGISHDDPALAPLKSGAARMALQAHSEGVAGIRLLPMGLVFEAKERPDSRVLVRVGEALDLDSWLAARATEDAHALTEELTARLRAVTLNFASAERAARAVRLARVLSALAGSPAPVDQPRSLEAEAELALRIDTATAALPDAPPHVIEAADELVAKLDTLERELRQRGIALDDVRVSTRVPDAVTFVAREGPLALFASITMALGWATHWIPLRAARVFALRSLRRDASRDQPAMRTILFGLSAVVLWYIVQGVVVARIAGVAIALLWLAVIFAAAHARRLRGGRLTRAVQRARSFLAFRANPTLQPRLVAVVDELLVEALALEQALVRGPISPAIEARG